MSNEKTHQSWLKIIQTVQTPLGFFVLVVLVIEVILATTAAFREGFDRTFLIIGMIVLIFLLVVIVAFLAYWRPEALHGKSSKDAENTLDSDTPKAGEESIVAKWGSGPPTTEKILRNAEHSVLLLGTSHFRVVHDDLYHYNEWLENNQRRLLCLLFINPHSPHAFRRERKEVQRSSQGNIANALEVAYQKNKKDPHFIPAIYDGPYRYSARAIDICPGWTSSKSMITIFTSSHNRGISEGFRIRIRQNENPECFEFYRNELLDLWKTSLSNPAGHGVSIISRWPNPPNVNVLGGLTNDLLGQLTTQETDYKIFLPGQFHLTIASFCRTQTDVFAGPLCIGSENEACDLPAHFPEFVIEAVKALADAKNNFLDFNFSRLVLDNRGYIILEPDENERVHSIQILNDFTETLQSIVDRFNEEFPSENWNQRLQNGSDYRFKPKFESFFPHITIGRAFNCHNSLPIPLTGEKGYIQISSPIGFVASDISIVHYAYRSLLRCVGEISITQLCSLNKNEVVHFLRL